MTGWANRNERFRARAGLAAALAFALVSATLPAQDGQFDLRDRATPTPEPTVVGPVDPENPVPRPRPRAEPSAAAPPIVLPSASPAPTAAESPPASVDAPVARSGVTPLPPAQAGDTPAGIVRNSAGTAAIAPPGAPVITDPTRRPPAPYQPRNLDLVAESGAIGMWLALVALALLLGAGGWLVWSRYFRTRVVPLAAPEIERPRLPESAPTPPAAPVTPVDREPSAGGLELVLQATRMSATLMNTTLSYQLSLTNRSATTVRNVRVDGDMVAAHANRPHETLFGPYAPVLPELHHIAALAPGETATLSGDIRLPLVAITPIRRGNAAFFVPLARLRARGIAPTGISVEGGGTFLVGQEPGANRKLQPFRLDLGPRNYSKLGQHLLPAA